MATITKHQPLAPKASQIIGPHYRITILADGLIRFESSKDGKFEDRASMFAINRNLPTPKFERIERDEQLEIVTDRFHLEFDRKEFSASGLTVTMRAGARYYNQVWRYGQKKENLGGTTRTLDFVDGRTPVWDGVLSRYEGFAVIEDSKAMMFTNDGWVGTREDGRTDFYLFAYGRDYRAALKVLFELSGHCPILPRWVLGNWWSRYYAYTQDEYLGLMDRFQEEKIPMSVAVIDMDWHLVDVDPKFGTGWTGWSWNKKLFPDHVKFLKDLHDRGLSTTLCTHPADGVRSYEDIYPRMCEALGRDPKEGHTIFFDPTSKKFMDAYFNVLHRSLEDEGVDFWWPDWQQGEVSKIAGIDPLWMLNHFHFLDSGRDNKRPIGFSRYAGPGGQRYPVGFSGDTVITWESLQYQPEFTATASNVGFGWWSHDIGGHHHGYKDDELEARWVQVGVWSPVLRLHCSNGVFKSREPWRFNDEAREVFNRALRFRHRLVPYLYTMAVRNSLDGQTLIEPMYYDHPNEDLAYKYKNTFRYGSQLIACPVTTPRAKSTTYAATPAWIPKGRYVDIFTSTVYDGDRVITFHRPLDKVPVLAKEGSIVPLDSAPVLENGCPIPDKLEILLVVGQDGSFELVEDDGAGAEAAKIHFSKTPITFNQKKGELTIGPNTAPLLDSRDFSIRLLSFTPGDNVSATCGGKATSLEVDAKASSPSDPNGVLLRLGSLPTNKEVVINLGTQDPQLDIVHPKARCFHVIDAAQIEDDTKHELWDVVEKFTESPLQVIVSRVRAVDSDEHVRDALLEILLADPRASSGA